MFYVCVMYACLYECNVECSERNRGGAGLNLPDNLRTKNVLATVDDSGLSLGTPEVIVSGCPPLALHSMATWMCLVPLGEDSPYPPGLLLFWCPGQHCVQVMITSGR